MGKLFKFIGLLIGIIILLIIIAIGSLFLFVNPNHLKPIITQQVEKITGRTLTIKGNLSWTLYPSIGIKVGEATLNNPTEFGNQPFADVKQATVSVKVLPLFEKKIETNELDVNGLTINLIKNTQGKTNWQNFTKQNSQITNDATPEITKTIPTKKTDFHLSIAKVNFKNVTVTWQDLKTNQQSKISNLNLEASNIQYNNPFPLKLSFTINNNKPDVNGNVDWTSELAINPNTNIYQLNHFTLKTNLKGNSLPNNQLKQQISGNVKITINPNNTDNFLSALTINGDLYSNQITIGKITLTQFKSTIDGKNGIIKIAPITANLYHGSYNGNITVNAKNKIPTLSLNSKLSKINFNPLLNDLMNMKYITGTGDLQFNVSAQSFDTDTMMKTLNGNAKFGVYNGTLQNVDAAYYLRVVKSLLKKQTPPSREGANETNFGSLTGTASINNGVITCNDLLLQSKVYTMNGQGNINLPANKIDYRIQAREAGEPADTDNVAPIKITGRLNDPSINIDESIVMKKVAKKAVSKITDEIQKNLGKHLDILKGLNF